MAFTSTAVWEIETGGNDTNNGGGFDAGVAGFPTDGAATSANTASPVFSSASYNFVSGDVGAWVYIKAGTNWTPGWYKIASVNAGAATLSAAIGAAALSNGTPTTVAGCATTASPTAATWGLDYSQQGAAGFSSSTFSIDASVNTTLRDGTNTIGVNWIGNIISITSGTGFTVQRVAVVSTSGTAATVDKSLGTLGSTGGVGKLGGALASPGMVGSLWVNGNAAYLKTGTYTLGSSTANVATGVLSVASAIFVSLTGYSAVRGDMASPPTFINAAFTGISMIAQTAGRFYVANLIVDGNSQSTTAGFNLNVGPGTAYACRAQNCTNGGFTNGGGVARTTCVKCVATGCSTVAAFNVAVCYGCEAYANTFVGFNGCIATDCLSYSNTGGTSNGFTQTAGQILSNCTSYNNGGKGFAGASESAMVNCHAEGNTGVGFAGDTNSGTAVYLVNCSAFNNTGGATSNSFFAIPALLVPTQSVFVAASSSNFALNNLPGGGAVLRSSGSPGSYPRGLTKGYADIGGVQSRVPWCLDLEGSVYG